MENKYINVIVVIVVKNYMTIFSKMEVVLMNYKNPQRYRNGDLVLNQIINGRL